MDCPHIPPLAYGQFSERLHVSAAASRLPLSGSLEVTARCNLRCVHCYVNRPACDRAAEQNELSGREFCGLIDQMADAGCLWLLLTGGEPFIRPDFLDIYTHAKKRGLLITLFTNGTMITPAIADHLAEWPPFAVEITLYGRSRGTYEQITGVAGSHAKCLDGIALLAERKLPLALKTMVLTLNRHEIPSMKAYAESLGARFRFDCSLNKRLDGSPVPAEYRISPQQVLALDLSDEKRAQAWKTFCSKFWGPPVDPERLYQCGAGISTFHVDPCGRLSPCILSRVPSYDLRSKSFREGWFHFLENVSSQKTTSPGTCATCERVALCEQCPGWARLESGNPEDPVEYLCQIAHLRAKAFGPTSSTQEKHSEPGSQIQQRPKALPGATAQAGAPRT